MHNAKHFLRELFSFTIKQARACMFAGSFFVLLFLSLHIQIPGLARYDFIFLGSILIQLILVLTKIETKEEVKVIFLFHVIGFFLEAFKTHPSIASWSYPEPGFFKLFNVPLYSGFMYAAVGSYISQSWKIMQLRTEHYPKYLYSVTISALIYINFFTHHFLPDIRYLLAAAIFITFWKTKVYFTAYTQERSMPLAFSFILIGFFIWVAENISTLLGAWKYPNQQLAWELVSLHKITAWSLLVIISVIIVFDLKLLKNKSTQK